MAETVECVHKIIQEVNSVPVSDSDTATLDQLSSGVMELLNELLHTDASPEQLEAGVAVLRVLGYRYAGLVQDGHMTEDQRDAAALGIGEMLCVLSEAYIRPAAPDVVLLEAMLVPTPRASHENASAVTDA